MERKEGTNLMVPEEVLNRKETVWINDKYLPFEFVDAVTELIVSDADIADAEARLHRFAPFIKRCFPETAETGGLIESELADIPHMKNALSAGGPVIQSRLMMKMDSHLPIAGSIKARGGIYEVLKHAEDLAVSEGLLKAGDSYEKIADLKSFFRPYTVQVGSTGNLGLSIGIMSAAIGFRVKVHMSSDAKQWKKDLLRSKGVEVIEYADDYSKAVAEGRRNSDADPMSYFVDDEKSVNLFLGYAVAARRLKHQLDEKGILVDCVHPLIVYLPAGVGGAPGGVCYGLKRIFGDAVHCFMVEPVLCPSVLLGMATNTYENASVHMIGLSGKTEADGLACASPSGFVTRIDRNLVSGIFTVKDARLFDYLRLLHSTEQIEIEPSACASLAGPSGLRSHAGAREYCQTHGLTDAVLEQSTEICWATGGSLVPEDMMKTYLEFDPDSSVS